MLLTAQQISTFHEQGYLVLPQMVAPAACAALRELTVADVRDAVAPLEYEAEVGYSGAPASLDAPGGKTIRRLRGAYQRDPALRAWASAPEVVAKLQQLLKEPLCLSLAHHNCVMTKHPAYGSATNWHRDIRYWLFARNDLISVWLALGEETEANGALQVIPGSHRMEIGAGQLDALDFLRPEVAANQALFAQGVSLTLAPGDVVFFHSGLFHAAGKNTSVAVKASVVFAYYGRSNGPLPGSHSAAYTDVPLSA